MKNDEIVWSTDSRETKEFCEKAKIDNHVRFVETALIDGIVFVSGTAGKPEEFSLLKKKCSELAYEGFAYFGGRKENLARAFWKYRNLLYSFELDVREDELFNAGTEEEINENAYRIKKETDVLFERIKKKRK